MGIDFPPEEAARMFRVLYGMTGRAKMPPMGAVRVLRVVFDLGGGSDGNQQW